MDAMDTLKPGIRTGNFAPCRAGGFVGNHLIHSSFIPAKSVSSRRITVALTTRSSEVPAALRMADTLSRHCLVCSWIVSPTIFPVTGSCGPVPETNTSPAARTAWLYVGGGDGALGVRMMSRAINFSSAAGHDETRAFLNPAKGIVSHLRIPSGELETAGCRILRFASFAKRGRGL